MLTFLDSTKDYKLYDEQNRVVTTQKGTVFQIHQPDDLVFVQRQQDRRSAPAPVRAEGIDLRFAADPSAPRWSRHSYAPFVFGICRL